MRTATRTLALAAALCLLAAAQFTAPNRLRQTAQSLANFVRADPAGVADLFSPEFLNQVPATRLTAIFAQLHSQLGAVTAVKLARSQGPDSGVFVFTFAKGFQSNVSLALNNQPTHSITGLLFGPPQAIIAGGDSWDKLVASLRSLPGSVSFQAARITPDGPQSLASWQPDHALAIGSAFKLYILGTLTHEIDQGQRRWDQVVPLQAHSLPSGELQTWPLGTPLTLQSLANLMISISDNTAADQLLRSVGEPAVEALLPQMGNQNTPQNQPFLSTSQMFQLKYGDSARRTRYLAADTASRHTILASLPLSPPADLLTAPPAAPVDIEKLEWFASAADLGRALAWFQPPAQQTAREVLAINPGIPSIKSRWSYVGFKGGSEPGVISLNFLLQAHAAAQPRGDAWFTLSMIWNNPAAPVSESQFLALTQRALALLHPH
ncbi:MAG: serine hydrolase [Terriglobales bacterium]